MDYDFTEHYKKGDVIFHVRCIEKLGIQEVNKLTLGTVNKSYIIGYKEKSDTSLIGVDQKDYIFLVKKDADNKLKEISTNMKPVKKADIPSQLIDEVDDNLDSYIEGGEEDE